MLSYFKVQQPFSFILFVAFFIGIKLPYFLHLQILPIMPVQSWWTDIGLFFPSSAFLNVCLAQLCLLAQALWFNYLFNQADFHESNSLIPAVMFAIVTAILPEFNQFSIYMATSFLLLFLFQIALNINSRESAKLESFNLGLIGACLALVNVHFILLIPFLFLMLYALKSFRISEYIMLLFGILFVFYFAIGISYVADVSLNIDDLSLRIFYLFQFKKDTYNIILLILTAVYLCFAFVSLRGIMFSTGFKRRKNVNMLILFFIGLVITLTFARNADESILSILFIPVSVFLTLFMLRIRKKRLGEILNIIFITVTIVTNIVKFFK
ncbi:MAG: DUF6427 family protein [Chitinophagales bacterium]